MNKILLIVLCAAASAIADTKVDRDSLAKIKHDYKHVYFREEVKPTVGKNGCFVTVPKQFKGFKVNRLESVDDLPTPLKFKVESEGNVLLIAQHTTIESLQNDGWTVVDEFKWNHDRFPDASVLMKSLPEGEYEFPSIHWMGTRVIWR